MGEGPALTTSRLLALPLTVWNAGFVAEELGPLLAGACLHRAQGIAVDAAGDPTAALRRDLRRRAGAGRGVMTWTVRGDDSAAVGLLAVDAIDRRALVSVSIGRPYRRRGYATEALRALASWLEFRGQVVVESRVRVGDRTGERLAVATAFVPADIVLADGWRVWFRPPPP
ncbi:MULTISPECIES: GNAT family N-acetyltransferase [unclassified Frankia]|uniref:GNAT family N-acetyltransferase n=1 Tax=unclassified Frankia TaxID=2632575 RepID=UPI001EF52AE4|nr:MULTISPECIES: GNAT family N-acetyltransferase [unclassified Frankia]